MTKKYIFVALFIPTIVFLTSCATLANQFAKIRIKETINILSSQQAPNDIAVVKNIAYIQDGTNAHLLDVYYPSDAVGPFPVIINIHGGGFIFGDKDLRLLYCCNLAKEGYIVYNINYRLAKKSKKAGKALNEGKLPDQIIDVAVALNFIYENFQFFPANAEKIYLIGDSAGAYLATLITLIATNRRLQDIFQTPEIKTKINALGLVSGYMKIEDNRVANSVVRSIYLAKNYEYSNLLLKNIPELKSLPPVFMTTNSRDEFGYMTYYFERLLKANNSEYQLYVPPHISQKKKHKLGHIFNILHLDWDESRMTNKAMLDFLSCPPSSENGQAH